jgi:hypothetical protein
VAWEATPQRLTTIGEPKGAILNGTLWVENLVALNGVNNLRPDRALMEQQTEHGSHMTAQPPTEPRLLDQVRAAIRSRHFSVVGWAELNEAQRYGA